MRTLCELFIIAGLIYLGWEKSFQSRVDEFRGVPKPAVAQATPVPLPRPTPTPTPDGAWMHDPNHRSPLDTPAPRAHAASTPKSGAWLFDPNHRSSLDPPDHGGSPHP